MLLMLWMVPLHFLWSVDSTKYISRRRRFLLNFNLWQLSQRTLVYVAPRGYLGGCVPTQQCFRVQILVSSGTFLMSLALAVTSCYMKNFGWCMVFSFWLFCIAEEDTILTESVQFAAACLLFAVRRASLIFAYFSPFFSFPCVSVHFPACKVGTLLVVAVLREQYAPWQSRWRARERSCGSAGISQPSLFNCTRRWMIGKVMKRMWIIFSCLPLGLLLWFYLSWWDVGSGEDSS